MSFSQVNGLTMFYKIQGHGSPLILIAGFGSSHIDWSASVLNKLSTQHQVIVFDNRGIGQTDHPTEFFSMSQLADDAIGLLDFLNINKAHVLGTSMGGMIAQHVALNYPHRVRSLILGCTSAGKSGHPILVEPSTEIIKTLIATSSANRAQTIRKSWSICYTPAFLKNHLTLLEEQLQMILAYPAPPDYTYKLQIRAMIKSHDTLSRLSTITHSTLIQTGLEDQIIPPQNSKILAEHLPNAQLIEYPKAAHGYLEETDLAAVEDILAFLQEVEATY